MFELADGSLDDVAPFVDFGIEVSGSVHARSLGDDRSGADGLDMVEHGVSVIGLVGDDVSRGEADEQRQRMVGIVGLSTGQEETNWPAKRVDGDVPLAGQSPSGTPQSLVFDPPFWPVAAWACARTMALSIIRYSLSRSLVSA